MKDIEWVGLIMFITIAEWLKSQGWHSDGNDDYIEYGDDVNSDNGNWKVEVRCADCRGFISVWKFGCTQKVTNQI